MFGLMPHPEHAVDPLTGPTGGLAIFESIRAHIADGTRSPGGAASLWPAPPPAKHRELGLTDAEYELIVCTAWSASPATPSWRCCR